jgi:RNA polymerase sigma factor (sigma-70 family)
LPQPPPTRASLLVRLADPADCAAWDEFVRVYGPLVLDTVRRRGFDHSDAEDIAQRVFARVFRGLRTFSYATERGRFRDWLGTILHREVVREYRTRARKPATLLAPEDLDSFARAPTDPEWIDAFQAHLYHVALGRCQSRFEPQTWTAFEQLWIAERSAADVAADLGISIGSVYVAKSRVLSALAQSISELSDELPNLPHEAR